MKNKTENKDINPSLRMPLPNRSSLDKKAEKYLRAGGNIEELPNGDLDKAKSKNKNHGKEKKER